MSLHAGFSPQTLALSFLPSRAPMRPENPGADAGHRHPCSPPLEPLGPLPNQPPGSPLRRARRGESGLSCLGFGLFSPRNRSCSVRGPAVRVPGAFAAAPRALERSRGRADRPAAAGARARRGRALTRRCLRSEGGGRPRDLQLAGQPPGAPEKASQGAHRLHRPSAGAAGAQLRAAEIPERAGPHGARRLAQPHRHAGQDLVPEPQVRPGRGLGWGRRGPLSFLSAPP